MLFVEYDCRPFYAFPPDPFPGAVDVALNESSFVVFSSVDSFGVEAVGVAFEGAPEVVVTLGDEFKPALGVVSTLDEVLGDV